MQQPICNAKSAMLHQHKWKYTGPIKSKNDASLINRDVVVFDFDGVLFNNKAALGKISDLASTFVAHKLASKGFRQTTAKEMNTKFYSSFGHSVNLINSFGNDPHLTNITEYNHFVFEEGFSYKDLLEYLNDTDIALGCKWRRFILDCQEKEIPVYVFSNSPSSWCSMIAKEICLGDVFNESTYICTDSLHGQYKPNANSFLQTNVRIEREIDYEIENIYFVDDSMLNIATSMNVPKWRPIMFSNKLEGMKTDALLFANSVSDVRKYVFAPFD